MRLYTVTTSRAAPYDRTPITRVNTYVAGAQAPHATTQRWTYTVPAGKKFTNGVGQASAQRNAVAAPAGPALAFHRITPNGGALTSANSALLDATNLVGGIASAPLSNLLLCSLAAGIM